MQGWGLFDLCRLKDQGILKYFESCCRLLFWVYHGVSTQRVGFPRPDYSTLEGFGGCVPSRHTQLAGGP